MRMLRRRHVVVHVVIPMSLVADTGWKSHCDCSNWVQIPRPRPFLYSQSAISESLWSQRHTAGSQFPTEQPNRGGVNAVVLAQREIAGQRPVATQRPKPADAQGRTVRL